MTCNGHENDKNRSSSRISMVRHLRRHSQDCGSHGVTGTRSPGDDAGRFQAFRAGRVEVARTPYFPLRIRGRCGSRSSGTSPKKNRTRGERAGG